MHHKCKKPRKRRGCCTLCKTWKINGWRTERKDGERFSDHRRRHMIADDFEDIQSSFFLTGTLISKI